MKNVVGSSFENALNSVDDPASTYWIAELSQNVYVPPVADRMGCWEIGSNMKRLEDQIAYWKRFTLIQDTTGMNASMIMDVQQMKYDDYKTRGIAINCIVGEPASGSGDTPTPTDSTGVDNTTGSKSLLIPLLIGGAGIYLISRNKKKKVSGIGSPVLIFGGLALVLLVNKSGGTVASKKTALMNWNNTDVQTSLEDRQRFAVILSQMSDAEINSTYDFIFNYVVANRQVPEGSSLYWAIRAISTKYQIFT
jgi:hypothetical protein